MAITINGVLCQELVADFREGYDLLAGPMARKGFLCAWSDRSTVARGLIGLSNTTSVGGLITLQTPLQYPELATMYAKTVEIIPVGLPTQGSPQIQWTNAIVYCNYGCLPWSFSGIDSGFYYNQIDPVTPLIYCEQTIQTSTSYMTIPSQGLVTSAGNLLADAHWQLPLFQAEITLTFMRVPYFPAQAIFISGKSPLNSTTFLGLATRYVMFTGSSNKATRDTAGNFTQDLTLNFSYRNLQWDYTWDPIAQGFYQVKNTSGGAMIATSDLNSLIPQGYLV